MTVSNSWQHMSSAPKSGDRILATIRPSEQGAGAVDLIYWANGDHGSEGGWRSSDSTPGMVIQYAEPELKCWMPMPEADIDSLTMPEAWDGDDDGELNGSGI